MQHRNLKKVATRRRFCETKPLCQLSVVSCQLSVVSCQLSVVSCQLSVVSCQSSVVRCEVEPIEVPDGTDGHGAVRGNRPVGEVTEGGPRSTNERSEIEEGQSSRPPASAEPGTCAADRGLEAMIDRARMRAEFEKRSPFRAERSPKSQDLARPQAQEPGAGPGPGPIRNRFENPSPRDPPTDSAIDA